MIAPSLACVAVVVSLAATSPEPPLAWSPSGDWLAFTAVTSPVERTLGHFPIFPDEQGKGGSTTFAINERDGALTCRVWAVRVEDGRALEVAEGAGPMTSPSWGPDGRALAFGRVVEADREGPRRWEVVVAYGDDLKVVFRRELDSREVRSDRLIAEPVAWEPAGKLLAVPDPQQPAIDLIEVEGGEAVRRIEGASLASFSPIGGRLAFFRGRGDRWELVETRVDSGPEADRPIDLVDRADQAPAWTSDGQAILYLKLGPPKADGIQVQFFCHRVDGEGPVAVKEVGIPAMPGMEILGTYLTVGVDGVDQYFAIQFTGRQSALTFHRGNHPMDHLHPFGGLGMLGAPALSPGGDRIAVRYGGPGPNSVVGLFDVKTQALSPIAPDDESRAAWIVALADAAAPLAPTDDRPTRLPFVSELGKFGPSAAAHARVAELGRGLVVEVDRSLASRSLTTRPSLVFSYLRGDYDVAERDLAEIARVDREPDHALRLLGLRAQLRLARGRDAEAREIIEFVRGQQRGRIARVEADGNGGFAVSREDVGPEPWPERLWSQHRERLESRPGEQPADPPTEPAIPPPSIEIPSPPGTIAPMSGIVAPLGFGD